MAEIYGVVWLGLELAPVTGTAIEAYYLIQAIGSGDVYAIVDGVGMVAVTAVGGKLIAKVGQKSVELGGDALDAAFKKVKAPNRTVTQYADGTFSVSDWTGYPAGVPRPPEGATYRLLTGSEYAEARRLANNANAKLRRNGVVPEGQEIHEIFPVKYGGSPTDPANKVYLPRGTHRSEVTPWWNRLQRDLQR